MNRYNYFFLMTVKQTKLLKTFVFIFKRYYVNLNIENIIFGPKHQLNVIPCSDEKRLFEFNNSFLFMFGL